MSNYSDQIDSHVLEQIDEGMQIQIKRFHEATAKGILRIGWKIGVTTAAAQKKFRLSSPVIGSLDGTRTYSTESKVSLRKDAKIRAEAEISLRINRDMDGQASVDEARAAIETVGPAIEFIDLNMPSDDISVILGHSIFHNAVIFGEESDPDVLARQASLWPIGRRNTKCVRTPEPAMIPHDLPALLVLVAGTLGRYGECLKEGDRIISGSYIVPLIVECGDVIEVDYGELGKVSAITVNDGNAYMS
ncbi:MAG: hypothetical protein ACE5GZ_12950 [Gammaproteobacteria bacterium]